MIIHRIWTSVRANRLPLPYSQILRSSHSQNASPTEGISNQPDKNLGKAHDSGPRDDELYRYVWLKCQGHEVEVLDSYEKFLKSSAEHLEIDYVRTERPFRVIKRKTMLASRFVKKKYRVQYEVRTYFRDLLFKNLTGSTADTFLEYTQRNLPEGVMMIVEKHRLSGLPFELTNGEQQPPAQK